MAKECGINIIGEATETMKPVLPSINDIDFKQLNMNDMPMPDAELMDAFLRDLKNHESGNLVPET